MLFEIISYSTASGEIDRDLAAQTILVRISRAVKVGCRNPQRLIGVLLRDGEENLGHDHDLIAGKVVRLDGAAEYFF